MKDKIFLVLGILIIGWSFYVFLQKPAPPRYQNSTLSLRLGEGVSTWQVDTGEVRVGDKIISVEVADTDTLRTQGLSGRDSLPPNSGMLFIFETPSKYGFWMKDMNFPLDIVWIDESWQVVGVDRLINPDTFPKVFYPNSAVKYVLEINSGETSMLGIDTGSKLSLDR